MTCLHGWLTTMHGNVRMRFAKQDYLPESGRETGTAAFQRINDEV